MREGRIADDDAEDRAGQHDLPVVSRLARHFLGERDEEREGQSDGEPEDDGQAERLCPLREPADQQTGDDPLEGGAENDTDDPGLDGGVVRSGYQGRQAVEYAEYAAQRCSNDKVALTASRSSVVENVPFSAGWSRPISSLMRPDARTRSMSTATLG